MTDLAKLRHVHVEILRLLPRLEGLIIQPRPPRHLHLSAFRHELSTILVAHLKAADCLLYPRLRASDDARIAAVARAFGEEMGGLAAIYAEYCRKWTAEAMADGWAGFCSESRELIDALTTRIRREARELFPMLERFDWAA
jgi:hypothetical protein